MPLRGPKKESDSKDKKRILANRYEIVQKLGSGNFGTVSICFDRYNPDETKVVKEIYVGDLAADETVDANHEALLLSKLKHPNIVKYYDSFVDDSFEYFCIITEHCEGGDLDDKINEVKRKKNLIPEPLVLDWFVQLVLAVKYLHSQRVLHRDLKARNIFLRKNKVKIGDFGISRILMSATDFASTFTGTPYYMSPEVLKHEGYNSKSDIWSVGCILYELCALDHAFDGQGLMAIMYKIVEGTAPDLPKQYSKELDEVFKRIVNKNPEKRPSATDITQIPLIAKHISEMKDLLSDEVHTRTDSDTIGAQKLHGYISKKSHLGDMQSTKLPQKPEKELTPLQKIRLQKLQKAEEERLKLSQHIKENYKENQERKSEIRTMMSRSIAPAWKGGEGEGAHIKRMLSRDSEKINRERQAGLATYADLRQKIYNERYEDEDGPDNYSTIVPHSVTLGARPSSFYEDRPITPMKNTMIYNKDVEFEDGVPINAEYADTYYSQFDDEFENLGSPPGSTPDDDEDDEDNENTIIERKKSEKDKEYGDGNETQDFISCLEGALKGSTNDTIVNDDTGFCGPASLKPKIHNLREQCIKQMGERVFEKAYNYIKNERSKDPSSRKSESNIIKGLNSIVKDNNDGFLVEQLYFIENKM